MHFATTIAAASLLAVAQAHVALWSRGLYGYNYPYQASDSRQNYNNNEPVTPLRELDAFGVEQWFGHGFKDFPPRAGDFMDLPAGGTFMGELGCNRADTAMRDPARTDARPQYACGGPDGIGPLHTANRFGQPTQLRYFGGTSIGIAYTSDIHSVSPNDMTIISVNQASVWEREIAYQIPAGLPPCPPEGCICSWNWIHRSGNGEGYPYEIYNLLYRCRITGETNAANVVQRGAVPRDCKSNPANCVSGPKTGLYVYQRTGNNIARREDPPTYSSEWGFSEGAQNDIFVAATTPAPTTGITNPYATPTGTQSVENPVPTATALPASWRSLGCTVDQPSPRILANHLYTSDDNTISMCVERCEAAGYSLCSVQYGKECWGGNTNATAITTAREGDCDVRCPGDPWSFCGGSYRGNMFQKTLPSPSTSAVPTTSATATSASAVPTTSVTANSTTVVPTTSESVNTTSAVSTTASVNATSSTVPVSPTTSATTSSPVVSSTAATANSTNSATTSRAVNATTSVTVSANTTTFANGTPTGAAPPAANTTSTTSTVTATSANTTTAAVTSPTTTSRSSSSTTAPITSTSTTASSTTSTAPTPSSSIPAGWTSLGCHNEPYGWRGINGTAYGNNQLTTAMCINYCAERGFEYAGTQWRNGCFCGHSYWRAPTTGCDSLCAGNNKEFCGGAYKNSVYALIAAVSPSSSASTAAPTSSAAATTSSTSANVTSTASSSASSSASTTSLSTSSTATGSTTSVASSTPATPVNATTTSISSAAFSSNSTTLSSASSTAVISNTSIASTTSAPATTPLASSVTSSLNSTISASSTSSSSYTASVFTVTVTATVYPTTCPTSCPKRRTDW